MNTLLTFFRRLGTACPSSREVTEYRAETGAKESKPYWLLAHAGMPRY